MGVTYSPHPVPPTAGKKMQPPGNVGSEAIETSRKAKLGKTSSVVENVVKSSKAQDILAKRKADAAKATLPPLAEKSAKLTKVSETLARRKVEAAKVAAAEREKKKMQDPTVPGEADKGLSRGRDRWTALRRRSSLMLRRKSLKMPRLSLRGRELIQLPKLTRMLIF
jgi:hypothetical protein